MLRPFWSVSGLKSFFNSISITMSDALFKGDNVGLNGRHANYHLSLLISFQSYINPSSTVFHNRTSSLPFFEESSLEIEPELDAVCAEQLLPCDDPGSPVSPFSFSLPLVLLSTIYHFVLFCFLTRKAFQSFRSRWGLGEVWGWIFRSYFMRKLQLSGVCTLRSFRTP